jgi:UDP-GlcNAc:undecaprenyl-phosphate GlcNAc-1-phosphate transferase
MHSPAWQPIMTLVITYLATLLLVPLNIKFSHRYRFLAEPNARSIHSAPIPTAGGFSFGLVAIFMQGCLGLLNLNSVYGIYLLKLSGISILLLLFGLVDDRFTSRARYKLLWQIIIALLMYYAGYRVSYLTNPLGDQFLLGWTSLPITVFWFLLVMNAINLIDGMDGLAAGITCIVSLVLVTLGLISQNNLVILLALILFATNLAFLKYNFFPAKIFMGDTGSLIIGLNIAAISTAGSMSFKGITTITLMVPMTVIALPIIDTVLAFFRRVGKGSIFKADKAHLHHYLLELGWSQKTIAIVSYLFTFLFGLAGIGFSFTSYKVVFSILVGLMTVFIILAYIAMHKGRKT